MELFKRLIEIIDANLIYCLIPIVLSLMLIEGLFKNRFETKKVLNLVRWVIILYSLLNWAFTLIGMALQPEDFAVINRATGTYAAAYWIMFLAALILPFTLLIKKLASKFWFVLTVSFCIKLGVYFEQLIIITTSYHRDYQTEDVNAEITNVPLYGIGMIFLQGIIITIVALGILQSSQSKNFQTKPKKSKGF